MSSPRQSDDAGRATGRLAPNDERRLTGWIAPLARTAITLLASLPERLNFFEPRSKHQKDPPTPEQADRRAHQVDTYVFRCVLLELVMLLVVTDLRERIPKICALLAIVAGVHCVEIVAVAMRFTLFDRLAVRPGKQPVVATHERIVVLSLLNYFELLLCFAAIYAIDPGSIRNYSDWFDPIYLSAITQLTVGYGDVTPTGWLRVVAIVQGFFSLILLILLVSRFVSVLAPERSIIMDDLDQGSAPGSLDKNEVASPDVQHRTDLKSG